MTVAAPSPSPGSVLVGCSGWTYASWRGRFYPDGVPQRRWLEHYASRFPTVESNATFYRLPRPSTVRSWAARVPDGFVFAVKLGAFGSHRMKLRDAASWLPNHVRVMSELDAHLGPTLVQLPPSWRRDIGRLDDFLSVATSVAPTWRWAVELREPSWVHDDTFSVLHRHGAALCLHDLLPSHPSELTAGWTYLRFHGPHALDTPYCGRYGPARLARWADRIRGWQADGTDVVAYFNNDVDAAAVADARWLARRTSSGQVRTPGARDGTS